MELKVEVPVVVTPVPSNMAIMREALSEIVMLTVKAGKSISCDVACGIIASKAKHALKQPPRNCDIGDAADWENRFGEECDKGHTCSDCPIRHAKRRMAIELHKGARCEFVWAQMPYAEGGEK